MPADQKRLLFRRNLDSAEMLTYVFNFNQQSWAEEVDFMLGKEDRHIWEVSIENEGPYRIDKLTLS